MNREIKFRAWDKENNVMLDDITPSCVPLGVNDLIKGTTLIPLQYTGFKDLEGVEIYDGDIIEDGTYAGVINLADPFWLRNLLPTISRSKIGGNIFENPELFGPHYKITMSDWEKGRV